jgi:hypothetical protein
MGYRRGPPGELLQGGLGVAKLSPIDHRARFGLRFGGRDQF